MPLSLALPAINLMRVCPVTIHQQRYWWCCNVTRMLLLSVLLSDCRCAISHHCSTALQLTMCTLGFFWLKIFGTNVAFKWSHWYMVHLCTAQVNRSTNSANLKGRNYECRQALRRASVKWCYAREKTCRKEACSTNTWTQTEIVDVPAGQVRMSPQLLQQRCLVVSYVPANLTSVICFTACLRRLSSTSSGRWHFEN